MRSFATIVSGTDSVDARLLHLQSRSGQPHPGQTRPTPVENTRRDFTATLGKWEIGASGNRSYDRTRVDNRPGRQYRAHQSISTFSWRAHDAMHVRDDSGARNSRRRDDGAGAESRAAAGALARSRRDAVRGDRWRRLSMSTGPSSDRDSRRSPVRQQGRPDVDET